MLIAIQGDSNCLGYPAYVARPLRAVMFGRSNRAVEQHHQRAGRRAWQRADHGVAITGSGFAFCLQRQGLKSGHAFNA